MKKFKKILFIMLASIILLLIAIWLLIQTTPVQNWLVHKITGRLSKDLQSKVEIKHVDFSLFNKMNLEGVLVEDRQKDTILNAGAITVNITDWFFFKKNIELKYIGLKDAYVKLHRKDSIWRHAFILDYFTTPASKGSKKSNPINIALKEIDLQNIHIVQKDEWIGQDMNLSLTKLNTVSKAIDFAKKIIEINSLKIDKPYFALHAYKGNKPRDTIEKKPAVIITDSLKLDWNNDKWQIFVNKLTLKDGTFKNDSGAETVSNEKNGVFDSRHIEFANINADFNNVKWFMDTITTSIKLSSKERSGFEIKKLIANAKVTPKEMTFKDLDIITNESHLQNYFSMRYADFSDMSDFIDKVKLAGKFNNASISSNDISFFAPALSSWKKKINFSGNITGPVSALNGQELEIQAGTQTYFKGDASINGLPDINQTFIDAKADNFKTTYNDGIAFVPSLKKVTKPNISKLQYVQFKGSFTGFLNDFVTYGTIQTALGTAKADVNMKIPKGKSPVYSGNITTKNFNLGAFIDEPSLGYISTSAKLKGAGFNPEKGNVALEANIDYLDYNKYHYQNIIVDGELNKKVFNGIVKANDPNAKFILNGLVDYSKPIPDFNFMSNIEKINLKELNFTNDNVTLTGKVDARFSGKTIDNFLGKANLSDATLVRDGLPLSFDSLSMTSAIIDGQKQLKLNSNEFAAVLTGNFNIKELPNSVKTFLARYYPSYIKPPKTAPKNQVFSFDITTYNVSDFIHIADSSLSGFNNSHVSGSINTFTNDLQLQANVPDFDYANYRFANVNVNAVGNYDSLAMNGNVANISVNDSLDIPMAEFNITAQNDVSRLMLYTGGNSTVNQARLNAIMRTYSNGIRAEFEPSSFIVNGKIWTIEKDGELEFRTNVPAHGQLALKESNQEILIKTLPSDVGNWNDVAISIKNLNLGDIAPFILPQNRLEGLASANVFIENPGKKMRIISNDFMGKGIRLDNDSLGNITANVIYDMPTSELIVNGKTLNPDQKDLSYNIHLYLKDKESQAKNVISLDANRFDLKYLNRFLGFLFSDIQGEITGKFDIKGPLNNLYVVGKGKLQNAGLKVNFTQCFYKIEDRDIELKENEINLAGIILRDTVTKNPVYLTGNITHNAFKDMFFDLTVSTRKPGTRDDRNNRPVQVLKTTYNDNKLFYGDVKATGSFALVGTEENTYMKIDAIASSESESKFTIASATSKAGKMPDWLVEKKYGQAMADSNFKNQNSNIDYDLDVTANRNVLMKFVMDDLTGDEITGRGSGPLTVKSGTSKPLTINGRLDIEEGSYNYTFQSFFKKPFEIKKGEENYIAWNGDPINANINLNALYKAERVSFAPLTTGSNLDASYANTRENVYVNTKLKGQLFKPEFEFGLELDPNSKFRNEFNVSNALDQISKNANEITRQVTYLIVFNSFAPPESGVGNMGLNTALSSLTYNTLSGLFFNEINKVLNNELSKLLGTNVSVVLGGSVYNSNLLGASSSGGFTINQANLSSALVVPLFKDRFVVSLGSSLEVPLQSSLQQTVQFLPDVTFAWLINASGTIRANFFYRENLDLLTTSSSAARLKRTGIGLSYSRDFDRLSEIFNNLKKKTLKDMENMPLLLQDSIRTEN